MPTGDGNDLDNGAAQLTRDTGQLIQRKSLDIRRTLESIQIVLHST